MTTSSSSIWMLSRLLSPFCTTNVPEAIAIVDTDSRIACRKGSTFATQRPRWGTCRLEWVEKGICRKSLYVSVSSVLTMSLPETSSTGPGNIFISATIRFGVKFCQQIFFLHCFLSVAIKISLDSRHYIKSKTTKNKT